MRVDGRKNEELRKIEIIPEFVTSSPGSVLFIQGNTKVLATCNIVEGTAPHLRGTDSGWITAEYSLLPGSTFERKTRERFKISGRTLEIQRFIGRSLRSVTELSLLGENTIYIDCDVIQADGGTRCASINAGFIAFYIAVSKFIREGKLSSNPIKKFIGSVSCGKFEGEYLLDLNYEEDSKVSCDGNFVFAEDGEIVEIQILGERDTLSFEDFNKLYELAYKGSMEIIGKIKDALKDCA